jgi:hypothetical protein
MPKKDPAERSFTSGILGGLLAAQRKLRCAKALGLEIPPTMLALAAEAVDN